METYIVFYVSNIGKVPRNRHSQPEFDIKGYSRYFEMMIKDAPYLDQAKRTSLAGQNLSLDRKFDILNALYEEARLFGHFQESDILAGLDHVVRLAAILNANVSGDRKGCFGHRVGYNGSVCGRRRPDHF
jgi:hypothetical protein